MVRFKEMKEVERVFYYPQPGGKQGGNQKPSTEVVGPMSFPTIYVRLLAMIYSYFPVR